MQEVESGSYQEKALQIEAEETNLLKDILIKEKKQLFFSRIVGWSVLTIALMFAVTLAVLVPMAVNTLNNLNDCINTASATLATADATMGTLSGMSDDISTAATGINTLLITNSQAITDSMTSLSDIDYEGLNEAISDLKAVVEPLAKFFGVVK